MVKSITLHFIVYVIDSLFIIHNLSPILSFALLDLGFTFISSLDGIIGFFVIFKKNPSLDKIFLNSSGGQMICYKKDDNKICSEANTEIINKSKFDEREYF